MFKLAAPSLALAALAASSLISAFEVTFPTSGDKGYWVACQNNTLSWTSNSSDPTLFSVALLNSNQKELNGNYQIANSLKTSAGSAVVFPNCVAPGQYTVLFVNASNYALDKPEVYYTTPSFEIKANGTAKPDAPAASSSSSSTTSSTSGNASSSLDASSTFASGPGNSSANASQGNGALGMAGSGVPLLGAAAAVALGAASLLGMAL